MKYQVEKMMRNGQGEWFGFGPSEFANKAEATNYLARFADSQISAGVSEVRFCLRSQAAPRKRWQHEGQIYRKSRTGTTTGSLAHLLPEQQ